MPVQRGFACALDRLDAAIRIRVSGELDLHTVRSVLPLLDDASHGSEPLILDCADVTFMDSTALGHIHRYFQEAQLRRQSFVLVVNHASVLKVLRITGLAEVIPIVADLQAAKRYARITMESS